MTDPEPWDDAKIREAFIYDGGEAEYHDPIHGRETQRKVAGETFDRWLRAHDAALLARSPEPDVVVIRDSSGAPLYAIETKTAKPAHATDDETLRVLADLLSYRLLPDVVREHLAAYRDALIEMPTPKETT